jgi:uncharacterized protein (UPF0335 family)
MAKQKILVPYDFSPLDRMALDFLVQTFGQKEEIEVNLFHVYAPLPQVDATSANVTSRLKTGMNFLSRELSRKEEELKNIAHYLSENGFKTDAVKIIFRPRSKDVAEEILETIYQGFFNVVILTQRKDRITRFFVRNIQSRVLAGLRGATACLVT